MAEPEEKRRIIGHTFIDVFGAEAEKARAAMQAAQAALDKAAVDFEAARAAEQAATEAATKADAALAEADADGAFHFLANRANQA